ncbi:MAG TPA: S1/P1 Nuclease, partial [Sphingobacteriaceae bacterium]|nr:S1/P1 Nuclease [Sphingobacteriaceae bacterium]
VLLSSWGFFAHKQINRMAVFTLPSGMIRFYKNNIDFMTEHAVDPDKRRYSDSLEAPRHYLDADHYGSSPFDNIPEKWDAAVAKYSEAELKAHGIVPWNIQKTYEALVAAFRRQDSSRILHLSADLGHYVADAHVPLHTSENYNGQLTKQIGIHAFWESRLPELFSKKYNFFVGRATYIEDPLKEAWKIVRNTFSYKDSVLLIEARLNKSFPSNLKYTFAMRNGKVDKQYSVAYSKKYHDALNGMVERQMRSSISEIGSFWYSAWVDAGQPDMNSLKKLPVTAQEKKRAEQEDQLSEKGKIIGRGED